MSHELEHSRDDNDGTVTYRGPANWFTLDLPAVLELQQTEAFLEIKPRASEAPTEPAESLDDEEDKPLSPQWSLTLYAAWVDQSQPQKTASSFKATALFPGVVSSRAELPLELPGRCRTWAGISRAAQQDRPWWKRIWKPRRTYEWRLWIVEYQDIMIVGSLQTRVGTPLQRETTELCEAVLNSILFAEDLAKPPTLFREEVLALARRHFPLLETIPTGSFAVEIDGSEVNLSNFYRSYIHSPERISEIVLPGLTTVVRMQGLGPDQLMPALEEVSDRVMPMLYPEGESATSMKDFVQIPWVGGLIVMFVIDEDESYRFVHQRMLARWEISAEELQDLAMQNLEEFSEHNPLEVSLVGSEEEARMLVPLNPSPYNSVRLLGSNLHGRLRQILGREFVVGVPNRDFFVAVSLNHPDLIGQIQQKVIQDYQSMHHPLTNRLLVISADGVSEYCEN